MNFPGPNLTAPDNTRLTRQLGRIYELMRDGQWRTLDAISTATGAPAASASAQLRNLRKVEGGSHTVNRHHVGNGLYEYQLIVNEGWHTGEQQTMFAGGTRR